MCNLNEAMRILSKAHAQPYAEPKPLNKFRNFEDFENDYNNSKTPKNKKANHNLKNKADHVTRSGIYSNDRKYKRRLRNSLNSIQNVVNLKRVWQNYPCRCLKPLWSKCWKHKSSRKFMMFLKGFEVVF